MCLNRDMFRSNLRNNILSSLPRTDNVFMGIEKCETVVLSMVRKEANYTKATRKCC